MVDSRVDFSVIIPAYNEEQVIGPVIERLVRHLDSLSRPYEVLVVSDGSTDLTNHVVGQFGAVCGAGGCAQHRRSKKVEKG